MSATLEPFYMWAGGKTRMLRHYEPVWPRHVPTAYVEPFFGGGAVYGWLHGKKAFGSAYINDINTEIVGLLVEVRDNPVKFTRDVKRLAKPYLALDSHDERKKWFYKLRESYWKNPTPARLYLLMRTAFNGIWQTCKASNGLFGTPAGLLNHRRVEQLLNSALIDAWSVALKSTVIECGSYTHITLPDEPALIYLDPPYRDSFTDYSTGFGDQEQRDLADWYRDRANEGHTVILANRCVDGDSFFEDLLGDIGDFHYFDVKYTAGRRKSTEEGFQAKSAREFIVISR
jgi:DNA adenine methylase